MTLVFLSMTSETANRQKPGLFVWKNLQRVGQPFRANRNSESNIGLQYPISGNPGHQQAGLSGQNNSGEPPARAC